MKPNQDLYLDLMKKTLTAYIYEESSNRPIEIVAKQRLSLKQLLKKLVINAAKKRGFQIQKCIPFDGVKRSEGRDWPGFAYSMVGLKRLDNVQACIEYVLKHDILGDLIETGVWQGGCSIFMRAILRRYDIKDRKVWVADSFEGMPVPDTDAYKADEGYDLSELNYLNVSVERVKANFERFGLLDEQVRFLKGWFKDSLKNAPIKKIAVLRLDGDLYESTMDVLNALYHRVTKGGFVIIDDYHPWPNCKLAVQDFRTKHLITAPIQEIDGTGIFWQVDHKTNLYP